MQTLLETPDPDGGGLLITIAGAVVGEIERASQEALVFSHRTETGVRLAVLGHGLSGPLLRLTVPDVGRISGYGLTIEEVAGPRNDLRGDLAGYRLVLSR